MIYTYQKWFADCFSPQGDYGLVFLSAVSVAGRSWLSVSCRLRGADGAAFRYTTPVPMHAVLPLDWRLEIRGAGCLRSWIVGEGGAMIDIYDRNIRLRLTYPGAGRLASGDRLTINAGSGHYLQWQPVFLASKVRGLVSINGVHLDLDKADGYIDHVSSTILPMRVPVRSVLWGRAIDRDVGLTYTIIQDRSSVQGSLVVRAEGRHWAGPAFISRSDPVRDPGTGIVYPGETMVQMTLPGIRIATRWRSRRVLVTDRFMDEAHIRPFFINRLLGALARDPKGLKFAAEVVMDITVDRGHRRRRLTGINEYVVFR